MLFGHHNLISDTEPEEMLMNPRTEVQEYFSEINKTIEKTTDRDVRLQSIGKQTAIKALFGDKCLPDKTQDTGFGGMSENPPAYKLDVKPDKPSVQVEPMFSKGDKVKVVHDATHNGKIGKVIDIDRSMIAVELDDGTCVVWGKRFFEPYSEDSIMAKSPQLKFKTMETRELNLGELLKGHEGETFFHPVWGDVKLTGINKASIFFTIDDHSGGNIPAFHNVHRSGMACLYPNREMMEKYPLEAYAAWKEWSESRNPIELRIGCHICKKGEGVQGKVRIIRMQLPNEELAEQVVEKVAKTLQEKMM